MLLTWIADLDLELHAGEVVAIAGRLGSGRTELTELYGRRQVNWGSIEVDGRTAPIKRVSQAIDAGVVMVPDLAGGH